jgi:uncharacterized membrane protein
LAKARRFLVTGLATLLPMLLTVYLLVYVAVTIHTHVGSRMNALLRRFGVEIAEDSWQVFVGDAIAFLVFIALLWFAGFLVATYLGGMVLRRLDHMYRRVPLVRVVYPAVKQVTDFFLARQTVRFRRVVAVQYPRRGLYSIGFVTGEGLSKIRTGQGEQMISLFIPSSPAPVTGYTIFVPRSDVISLDLSVEEAVKLVVSGGVVVPDREIIDKLRALPGIGKDDVERAAREAEAQGEQGSEPAEPEAEG